MDRFRRACPRKLGWKRLVTYNLVGQRFNGTCLDYLADSFMAGNPLQGAGAPALTPPGLFPTAR